ncbi:uncharacterized protein C12orf56-like isoform X2 [Tubulanus polymorphus]|uniref:uncharacterized protein C12orf56-like isoform X2 n=1 Tax=Tubulanus polymorphus TaxID=672921 RepID=UPI003DA31AD0
MDRNGTESISKRNNSKFDTFLRRKLDNETFERIRYYEACVVCSEWEDKQFKYVVLGHEWLYLTENPPRSIRDAVHLKDIISIDLKNDFPDFLLGENKNNTLHVVVKYKSTNAKLRKPPKKDAQCGNNADYGLERASATTTSLMLPALGVGSLSPILKQKHLSASSVEQQQKRSSDQHRRSESWNDESYLKLSSSSLSFDDSSSDDDEPRLSRSVGNDGDGSPRAGAAANRKLQSLKHLKLPDGFATPPASPGSRRRKPVVKTKLSVPNIKLNQGKSLEDLTAAAAKSESSIHHSKSEAFLSPRSDYDSSYHRASFDDSKSHCSTDSQHSYRGGVPDIPEIYKPDGEEIHDELCLHLYMLNRNSPILNFTRSAWNNYIIRATLMHDEEFAEKEAFKSTAQVEKLDLLFVQLKQEILNPENKMEDVFSLVNELKMAMEKNFALKKLYWKSPELFQFMVNQIDLYMKPHVADINTDEGRTQRADQLELVNLLLESLCLVFRETEICPSRVAALKNGDGKYITKLLCSVTCRPQVPEKYVPLTNKAAKLLMQTDMNKMRCIADAEIAQLSAEFTNHVTNVVYELVLIAKQANWDQIPGNFFTVGWLVKNMTDTGAMNEFLKPMLSQAIKLLSPSQDIELKPFDAVLVYHQFFILQTFIEYRPQVMHFIKQNFFEEFKYFIQAPVIRAKLPPSYPIGSLALPSIEKVISKVLQKEIKLKRKTAGI